MLFLKESCPGVSPRLSPALLSARDKHPSTAAFLQEKALCDLRRGGCSSVKYPMLDSGVPAAAWQEGLCFFQKSGRNKNSGGPGGGTMSSVHGFHFQSLDVEGRKADFFIGSWALSRWSS